MWLTGGTRLGSVPGMDVSESSLTLAAAEGFVQLGLYQDGWDELERLAPEARSTPPVLRLRLHIFAGMKRWDDVNVLGRSLLAKLPPDTAPHPPGALRAFHAEVLYRLGCAECQLRNMVEAKAALERAFTLSPDLRLRALDDPDLEAIWA